ncbi:hypothetical protein RSSM_00431 [Rhodopirellula sallentina SM41]|uniref:Uncharacterized protein n=1 Tax=Rhodopirellula sallentina SM41 TaxID=1263870 RepID=M5UJW4_9BACT|nr:hypothetical protein RSSM_00431 [Rhodopirellula sallentina SM41]
MTQGILLHDLCIEDSLPHTLPPAFREAVQDRLMGTWLNMRCRAMLLCAKSES